MKLTVIITRDVQERYRGFLRSVMLEVDPGVYVSPQLSHAARERLWEVMDRWHKALSRGSIIMIWSDRKYAGNIGMKFLGITRKEFVETDNLLLTRKDYINMQH